MLFGWILSLCVDGLDPSYAYGDAWDMGVGWQVTVHVMFFYFGMLIFGYLFSYSGLVATFILDWLLVS